MNVWPHAILHTAAWVLAGVLAAFLLMYVIGCFVVSAPTYRGPRSDHFDGREFNNVPPIEGRRFDAFLKWVWTREPGPWLEWVESPYGQPPPEKVGHGDLRATVVNHSTVLIQMDGLNILTDPVWSERIGPVSWAGPKRHRPPGIRFEDLPPIDVVLLSHNHYDHIDISTLRRLTAAHRPRIFTGLGNKALLESKGIAGSQDMDWWDEARLSEEVTLAFVPSRHFSSRGLCDRNRTLWGGFVIKGPAGIVYFASDTGMGPQFTEIKTRYGPPRLALLPIGAFLPYWFMLPVHLTPEQAVEVHHLMGAGTSMPIHYGTFRLGDDGQFEPLERLAKEIERTKTPLDRFPILEFGTGIDVP
jgi:L-ascorbate metabolism protein UlaG (beta-lactamase superfamily)